MLVSEIGSLTLEFTRLSQLTGNPKYYDAIQRISDEFEKSQEHTKLPGMWPVVIDASVPSFSGDSTFTLGGMSDSLYEYLPKQYLMLGGLLDQPKKLYERFITVAQEYLFFRALNPSNALLLFSGDAKVQKTDEATQVGLFPRAQHLTCFTGGMVGLAAKIFSRPADLAVAAQLTDGCVWAYDSMPTGISPEIFAAIPCANDTECQWSEKKWHDGINAVVQPNVKATDNLDDTTRAKQIITRNRLPPGFTNISDKKYILRPEAIESVFIMYRITGDGAWQDKAWRMFEAVEKACRTELAASAIVDVSVEAGEVQKSDSMESFWLAETLKYFYLVFSEVGVVSLDEYVLNTEAHPLRRPGGKGK